MPFIQYQLGLYSVSTYLSQINKALHSIRPLITVNNKSFGKMVNKFDNNYVIHSWSYFSKVVKPVTVFSCLLNTLLQVLFSSITFVQ